MLPCTMGGIGATRMPRWPSSMVTSGNTA
jgi:hypothetical protein